MSKFFTPSQNFSTKYIVTTRGVPRLDGARGKKQVKSPHVRTCGHLGVNPQY